MKNLKFGVIGFAEGYYATVYTREMARTPGVEVVGMCDLGVSDDYVRACAETTAREFAASLGVPLYHEIDELLASDVDMVLITSESADHPAHAVKAIEAGKHVLLGKPAAITAAGMQQIIDAVKRNTVVVLPGEPARYDDAMITAAERLSAGDVGRRLMGRVFVNHFAMINHEWERDEARSGGPLAEFGNYACDILRWMMSAEPKEIFAYGRNFLRREINSWDNFKVLVEFEDGSLGSMDICCSIEWRYPAFAVEVVGSEGCIHSNLKTDPVFTHRKQALIASGPVISPVEGSTIHLNWREARHFVECVRGEAKPRITLHDALMACRMQDAIRESINTRQPVRL